MNLKFKFTNRLTHTVKFISDTQAIVSDECSSTHINALQLFTADTKDQLWSNIKEYCRNTAAKTSFAPSIAIIDPNDAYHYAKLTPLQTQSSEYKD